MAAANNETRNENSQITNTTVSMQDDVLKRLSAIIDVAESKLTQERVEDEAVEKAQLNWAQVELRAIQLCRGVLMDREKSVAAAKDDYRERDSFIEIIKTEVSRDDIIQ